MIGVVRRIDFGAVTLNTGTPDANGTEWWGRVSSGWGSPPIRRAVVDRPGQHGGWAGEGLYGPRAMTLEGSLVAATADGLTASLGTLDAMLADLDIKRTLTVYESPPKSLIVLPNGEPDIYEDTSVVGRFSLPVLAPDPWKYAPPFVYVIGLASGSGGGATFPATFPLVFSAGGSGGTATVSNGASLVEPTWTAVANPGGTYTGTAEYRIESDGTVSWRGLITLLVAGPVSIVVPPAALALHAPIYIDWSGLSTTLNAAIAVGGPMIVGNYNLAGYVADLSLVSWQGASPAPATPPAGGPSRPTWDCYGPVTNPRLTCDTTGEYIEFQTTLLAGDVLHVDHRAQTALLGTSSRAATKTPDSRWWALPTGYSVVRFTAATYDPAAAVVLRASAAYL